MPAMSAPPLGGGVVLRGPRLPVAGAAVRSALTSLAGFSLAGAAGLLLSGLRLGVGPPPVGGLAVCDAAPLGEVFPGLWSDPLDDQRTDGHLVSYPHLTSVVADFADVRQ